MIRDLQSIAQTQRLFVLQNGRPVRVTNPIEWMEWMQTTPRAAEKTQLPNRRELYTSFMGYCGEQHESSPYTFATAMKPEPLKPEFTVMLEWYYSWDDAVAGHQRYAQRFNRENQPSQKNNPPSFTPLVRTPEPTVYREDEMKQLLTPDQFDEYRMLSQAQQLYMSHLIRNGTVFPNAKRIVFEFPDDGIV